MTEPNPPPQRRRRWQMHLSTAVWMMIAAGGLIWGNTQLRLYSNELADADHIEYVFYGWPLEAITSPLFISFEFDGIVIDLFVALAILFGVWYVSEGWIRRRAGRKGK